MKKTLGRDTLAKLLAEAADYIEHGYSKKKIKIGITTYGNEHGTDEIIRGAQLAAEKNPELSVVLIGEPIAEPKAEDLATATAGNEAEAHIVMERMLAEGELDAAVTMHYNFPIRVATVGRVITPAKGKPIFLATSTGASDTNKVAALIKNAISGLAVARSYGLQRPTLGVLNLDGASQAQMYLKQLQQNGYPVAFSQSERADGGMLMRGNDLLQGVPDVMVTDSLTGNVLMKVLSAYHTGGNYEAVGYGYGPGVGEDYQNIICIISRASGAPVIAGAIDYAAHCVQGNLPELIKKEFTAARLAGLEEIITSLKDHSNQRNELIPQPPPKPATEEITGIDVMETDRALQCLWKEGIYAESGMGCTGPVIKVAEDDRETALSLLKQGRLL